MISPKDAPRPTTRRQPLNDATKKINNQLSTPTLPSSPPPLPQKLSLKLQGNAQMPMIPTSPPSSVDIKRLSTLDEEEHQGSKGTSPVSTKTSVGVPDQNLKTHIGPWQLGRTLGKGATGRVRLARHRHTHQPAAVKIVSKTAALLFQSQSVAAMDLMLGNKKRNNAGEKIMPFGIQREVVIMKLIEHPNIISLYDVWENRNELCVIPSLVLWYILFN